LRQSGADRRRRRNRTVRPSLRAGSAPAADHTVPLKLSHGAPAAHPMPPTLHAWATDVEAASGGSTGSGRSIIGGSIAGTLDYAAPEQIGKLVGVETGRHSDVFGFGRTLYYALFGVPDPDDEEKETLPDGLRRFLSSCPDPALALLHI